MSAGLWCCVVGWVDLIISKVYSVFVVTVRQAKNNSCSLLLRHSCRGGGSHSKFPCGHISPLCTVKVKWSRYRPGVAQRVGRGIVLLFHDCGTRRGWVVSSMPRPHFIPGKDPVPIVQEAGWAPGPIWMGGKSRPHRDSIWTVQPVAQSLYRLSYPAHTVHFRNSWDEA